MASPPFYSALELGKMVGTARSAPLPTLRTKPPATNPHQSEQAHPPSADAPSGARPRPSARWLRGRNALAGIAASRAPRTRRRRDRPDRPAAAVLSHAAL